MGTYQFASHHVNSEDQPITAVLSEPFFTPHPPIYSPSPTKGLIFLPRFSTIQLDTCMLF